MIADEPERKRWNKKIEFLCACVGFAVGYGNFWRFPYVCFKNGGGAFLVPYFIVLFLGGVPLFFLELSIGQYFQEGPVKAWKKISPLFSGVGLAMIVVSFLVSIYYNVIVAWSLYYLISSFQTDIPWVGCHHSWNTNKCYEFNASSSATVDLTGTVSPSKEFLIHNVLEMSSGIDEPGKLNTKLVVCLLVAWVLVYFCIWKGIRSTGKVVYFTATLPYVLLVALFVRTITLPGSIDGIMYFITPQWERLTEPKVWVDAASQIFYSLTIGFGVLIGFASYNDRKNNAFRDALIISLINCITSVFAGFVVFAFVGHMAHIQGTSLSTVASQGPGLVFIVYPATLAQMPAPHIWSPIFFVMMIFLGIDSQFGQVEVVAAAIVERKKSLHRYREVIVLEVCLAMFLLGLTCVTQGGIYVFNLLDSFAASISLLFVVIFELFAIGWIYGTKRFANNIKSSTGRGVCLWWRICWKVLIPCGVIGLLVLSVLNYESITFEGEEYPEWAEKVGWAIAGCSMSCIPLTAIYALCKGEGCLAEQIQSKTSLEDSYYTDHSSNNHELFYEEDAV